MIEVRCTNKSCRHDFVFEQPFRMLGQEVKCPSCDTVSLLTGEDSDDGFQFYLEAA